MIYSYNNQKFKELAESGKVTKTALRRICGSSNYTTVNRWILGCDIYVGKLISICNEFNLNLSEFITGIETDQTLLNKETNLPLLNTDLTTVIEYERKIAAIQLEMEKALSKERESKIKELADQELRLHKEMRIEFESERADLQNEYKMEIKQIEADFKNQLREKEQEIFELKKQLSDFQLAYKELELQAYSTGTKTPSAVAGSSKPYQTLKK